MFADTIGGLDALRVGTRLFSSAVIADTSRDIDTGFLGTSRFYLTVWFAETVGIFNTYRIVASIYVPAVVADTSSVLYAVRIGARSSSSVVFAKIIGSSDATFIFTRRFIIITRAQCGSSFSAFRSFANYFKLSVRASSSRIFQTSRMFTRCFVIAVWLTNGSRAISAINMLAPVFRNFMLAVIFFFILHSRFF